MKRAETIRLGQEILREFESREVETGILLLKAHRFAKLVGNEYYTDFLNWECTGYIFTSENKDLLIAVGRLKEGEDKATVSPLAHLETMNKMWMENVQALKAFQPSGPYALPHLQKQQSQISGFTTLIIEYERIITKVKAYTYQFVSANLNEAMFSQSSGDFFAQYQTTVDARIASTARVAFEKLPSVFERLMAGDQEAVSHALTSCRRIMEAFADAMFPPRTELVQVGGQELNCAAGKIKNQMQAFIWLSTTSESRRDRLNKNWRLLYDRVCAGVHSDVAPPEAQALVLNTYLILGELVELGPSVPQSNKFSISISTK